MTSVQLASLLVSSLFAFFRHPFLGIALVAWDIEFGILDESEIPVNAVAKIERKTM